MVPAAVIVLFFILASLMMAGSGWIFAARANYAHMVKHDRNKSVTYQKRKDGRYSSVSDCPSFMKPWHTSGSRCSTCGDMIVNWDKTRAKRVKVSLLGGPFLTLGYKAATMVTHKQPIPPGELKQQLEESENRLAEANQKLKEMQ